MTYTPGPWFFDKRTLSIGFSGGWIASVDDQHREGEGLGVIFDDGKLIAAAPDLLEVLRAVEWLDDRGIFYCPWCDYLRDSGHSEDCPRQQAIAKAEGEQP
jgi:hypothetical protein